jgi:hypothetical protein
MASLSGANKTADFLDKASNFLADPILYVTGDPLGLQIEEHTQMI